MATGPLPAEATIVPVQSPPVADVGTPANGDYNVGSVKNNNRTPAKGLELHQRARGNIIRGEHGEYGPESLVDLKLTSEYKAYQMLLDIQSWVENNYTGEKELSLFSEVISQKFPQWQERAKNLALIDLAAKENAHFLKKLEEEIPQPGTVAQGRRELNMRRKSHELNNRLDRINKVISLPEGEDRKKLIEELKNEFVNANRELNLTVDFTNIELMLKAYYEHFRYEGKKGTEPQYIFESAKEIYEVYQYLEYVEKVTVLQSGKDMVDSGVREVSFDLKRVDVNILRQKRIDPRYIQVIDKVLNAVKFGTMDDVADSLLTIGTTELGAVIGYISTAGGVVNIPLIGGIAAGDIGAVGGAALGLGAVTLGRFIQQRIRRWAYDLPRGRINDERTAFTLDFSNLMGGGELGESKDPIRQMYRGRGLDLDRFIAKAENFRTEFALALHIHDPNQLDGWLSLSSRALGKETAGIEMPHRILLDQTIRQILGKRYPADGGHKVLEALPYSDQQAIFMEAYDIVKQLEGKAFADPIIQAAAEARAKGEFPPPGINAKLRQLAEDILAGKKVIHPKENPITLEDKERELSTETARRERQTAGQTTYTQRLEAVNSAETDLRNKKREYESEKRKRGNRSQEAQPATATIAAVPAVEATGEILSLENQIVTAKARLAWLETQIGTGDPTDLRGKKDILAGELGVAKTDEEAAKGILLKRQEELQSLKDLKIENINLKKIPDSPEKDQIIEYLTRLKILQSKINPQGVENAQKRVNALTAKSSALERRYDDAKDQLKEYEDEAKQINKSETGTLATLEKSITTTEAAIEAKKSVYVEAQDELAEKIRERDELLRDVFGFEITVTDFAAPSADSVADIIKVTSDKVTKLEAELVELRKKKEAGEALVVSEEDKEMAQGLLKIAESGIFDSKTYNSFMQKMKDGTIKIDDLAKTAKDEGWHLMLKEIFGIDALSEGPEGNYRLTTRILNKSRLAEAVMATFNLDTPQAVDTFFGGDVFNPDYQAYKNANWIMSDIKAAQQELQIVERDKAGGWPDKSRELRRQINNLQIQRNDSLAILYDNRLAALLSDNRMQTPRVLAKALKSIAEDAVNGNLYYEILTITSSGPRSETEVTSQGQIAITEANRNELTGDLINRGALKITRLSDTGVSVETNISATGILETTLRFQKDQNTINILPGTLQANTPDELKILYGRVFRRKGVINPADLTQDVLNSVPLSRDIARAAGFPDTLLNLIYGPGASDPRRVLTDIQATPIVSLDPNQIAYEPENSAYAKAELIAYLYEEVNDTRRTVTEFNNFISSIVSDSAYALAHGVPSAVVDIIFRADGTRKDPAEIKEFGISRGVADTDRLEEMLRIGNVNYWSNAFFRAIAEGVSSRTNIERRRLFKDKFVPITVGSLDVNFEDGELMVYYNLPMGDRVGSKLIDFIRMSPQQANNVHPEIVAYILANPADQQNLIYGVGKTAVSAMREVL